jgi:hypothetical protein
VGDAVRIQLTRQAAYLRRQEEEKEKEAAEKR